MRQLRATFWLCTLVTLSFGFIFGYGLSTARGEVIVSTPVPPTAFETTGDWYVSSFSATDPSPTTGAQGDRVYAEFTLSPSTFPEGADLTRFSWEMIVGNANDLTKNPPGPLAATSYRVDFWSNSLSNILSNMPAGSLFTAEIPAALAHATFKGLAMGGPPFHVDNFARYGVSVDLPQPFHAAPNTVYWVSWEAFTPTWNPTYSWLGTGSGQTWQDRLDKDGKLITRLDREGSTMYYSLEGTATVVPEPSTWVLLTLGDWRNGYRST